MEVAQAGLDFGPWTTFTDGAYFQYLQNPATTGPPSGAGPLSSSAAKVNLPTNSMTKAWSQLMRTLAVTAPRQLREAEHARARIRRAVR